MAQDAIGGQVLRVMRRRMGMSSVTERKTMTTPHPEEPAEGPDDPATTESPDDDTSDDTPRDTDPAT